MTNHSLKWKKAREQKIHMVLLTELYVEEGALLQPALAYQQSELWRLYLPWLHGTKQAPMWTCALDEENEPEQQDKSQ